MLRQVLAVLALCCFVCTISACSGGTPALEKKEVKNKPGTNPKTGEETKDNTAASIAE
jgi:hypothetical protein